MKNRQEFRDIILLAVGDNSSEMITQANEAINQAILMGAMLFDPPELRVNHDYVLAIGSDTMSLASAPFNGRVLVVRNIWDSDNGRRVWFIENDRWDIIRPDVDIIKFYTLEGDVVWFNTTLSVPLNLNVRTTDYPPLFVDDTTNCAYDHHDEYIIATAVGLIFATIEEKDTVDMWSQVQGSVTTALGMGMAKRASTNRLVVKKE